MAVVKSMLEALFWVLMAALVILTVMVSFGLGGVPILGYIGIFILVLLLPVFQQIASTERRRRGVVTITYLEQAVRLNLPLPRMISAAALSERGRLRAKLSDLSNKLAAGGTVGAALQTSIPEAGAARIAAINVAERIGRLPHTLRRLVQQQSPTSFDEAADSVFLRSYPIILTIVMTGSVSFFAIYVMPKYQMLFRDFAIKLPPITLFTLVVLQAAGSILLAIAILMTLLWAGMALWKIVHPPTGDQNFLHRTRDRILWTLPLAHGLARDRGLADALDLMSDSLRAGQPIDRAAGEAAQLRVNIVLRDRLELWSRRLNAGDSTGEAAHKRSFPQLVVEMLSPARAGEQAAETIDFLARYYDARFSRARVLIRAAAIPIVIFTFAIVVTAVALSLIAPLVALINSLSTPSQYWRM